jgi:ATP-dependent DNA ligase
MPLRRRRDCFDHPEWIFELKYDGFRALCIVQSGRAQLISRNGNPFASYADLAAGIAADLNSERKTILDDEIVCLDRRGRPQFRNLLFRRGDPCFYVFDALAIETMICGANGLSTVSKNCAVCYRVCQKLAAQVRGPRGWLGQGIV